MKTTGKKALSLLFTLALVLGMFAGVQVTAFAVAPVLADATIDGDTLILTFTEALDEASIPDNNNFTVNGITAIVTQVDITGMVVTLTLDASAVSIDTVTVSYTYSVGDPLQSADGFDAVLDFSGHAVTNNTLPGDCYIGTAEYATLDDALAVVSSGDTIVLLTDITYTGNLTLAQTDPFIIDIHGYSLTINGNLVLEDSGCVLTIVDTNVGPDNYFTVTGDITAAGTGISTGTDGYVRVGGNITAGGDGVVANGGGVSVGGNINAGEIGVSATNGAKVYVGGTITAADYIKIGATILNATPPPSQVTLAGYKYYKYVDTDLATPDASEVYVLVPGQDRVFTNRTRKSSSSSSTPDRTITSGPALTWVSGGTFRADGVASFKTPVWAAIDGETVPSRYLNVSGNTVTISDAYLETLDPGEYRLALHTGDLTSYVMFRVGGGSAAAPVEDDGFGPSYNPSTGR